MRQKTKRLGNGRSRRMRYDMIFRRLWKSKAFPLLLFVAGFAVLGTILLSVSRAATFGASSEAESGTVTGNASTVSDSSASGGSAIKFGSGVNSGLSCANPIYTGNWPQDQYPGYDFGNGNNVGADVMTGATGSNAVQINVCSMTNWNVVANLAEQNGSINAYPDTLYTLAGDKTISQYQSLNTCYGMKEPIPTGPIWPTAGGSEWDYAYDVWINHTTGEDIWANDIEIMVWNDWTDTSIYPPSNARAVTIDGIPYHMWNPWGNEWIYTRDTKTLSGCLDMLSIMKDLIASNSAKAGITVASAPQHLEHGVEISGTHGTQTFQITNASLTVK